MALCLIAISLFVSISTSSAHAFFPNRLGHDEITREAVSSISRTIDDIEYEFTNAANAEIIAANRETDKYEYYSTGPHFTDEQFRAATERLLSFKDEIIAYLIDDHPNGDLARTTLGRALHTLQDFYSHSNWTAIDDGVFGLLGRQLLHNASPTTAMCPDDPNELGEAGLFTLTTTYFDFEDDWPCEFPAGKCGHRDFVCPFAGIDKDLPTVLAHPYAKSLATDATVDFLNQILDAPEIADNEAAILELMGKAPSMAFVIDTSSNMDFSNPSFPPVLATVQDAIVDAVATIASADYVPSSFILVAFDDTTISELIKTDDKDEFIAAVQALEAPTEYCEPVHTCDCVGYSGGAIEKAVLNSTIDGAVFVFTTLHPADSVALGRALSYAADSSRRVRIHPILMWADSDFCSHLNGNTIADPPKRLMNDSDYERLARNTLGTRLIYDSFGSSEELPADAAKLSKHFQAHLHSTAPQPFPLLKKDPKRLTSTPDVTAVGTITAATIPLTSTSQALPIPIDASVSSVSVGGYARSIGGLEAVSLLRPNTTPVANGVNGAVVSNFPSGFLATIDSPEPGTWQLEVEGDGDLEVLVTVRSAIALSKFEFVELAGTGGHEGFFSIPGKPIIGGSTRVSTVLRGPIGTSELKLVDLEEDVLQTLSLDANDPNATIDALVGTATIPTETFIVAAVGEDETNWPFRRIYPMQFAGTTVDVRLTGFDGSLVPGSQSTWTFDVHNYGSSDTFAIAVVDDQGVVTSVTPASFSISSAATEEVEVQLDLPSQILPGTPIHMIVQVESTTDATLANHVTFDFAVETPPCQTCDVCGDGVVGSSEQCDDGNLAIGDNCDLSCRIPCTSSSSTLTFIEDEIDGEGGVDGLNGAHGVATSPDGMHVYTASYVDHAVSVFVRNASTGEVSFVEQQVHGQNGVTELRNSRAVAVSPDGAHVYATSELDNAIVGFSRDGATGELDLVQQLVHGVTPSGESTPVGGLESARGLAFSPAGEHLYVAGYVSDAVAVFERNSATGELTFIEAKLNGAQSGGTTITGLNGVWEIVVSPDGNHLYAAAYLDDAVAVFERDPETGTLTFVESYHDGQGSITDLAGAKGIAISADGAHVYATSVIDDGVVVFSRNTASGELTFQQALADGDSLQGGGSIDGLNGAHSVAITCDETRVYVAGQLDAAVAVFTRNLNTGLLSYEGRIKNQDSIPGGGTVTSLSNIRAIAVAPGSAHLYAAAYGADSLTALATTSN